MDLYTIKKDVLRWLATLNIKGDPYRYRLSASTDDSAFTSCFALFILDLFGETDYFTDARKKGWAAYLNSFQNSEFGYYEPKPYHHLDQERNRFQLTCFCLSALAILNEKPKYDFYFMEEYSTSESVEKYLYDRGCHEGRAGSGNKAMFLAIFLTHLYETNGDEKYKTLIDVWFNFHDEYVNSSGFWGQDRSCHSFHGIQNGLHQFIVYDYWGRKLNNEKKIINVALSLQSRDGYFSPIPGGEACHDYDVVHTLVSLNSKNSYKKEIVLRALDKSCRASKTNQNIDGGFCQSKERLTNYRDVIRYLPFIFSSLKPYHCYYRLRRAISIVKHSQLKISTGWTHKDRSWEESSLWDTWFRCLIIAETKANDLSNEIKYLPLTKFHNFIGLGHLTLDILNNIQERNL